MRVLLDENLPHDLTKVLTGHVAFTVQGLGWAGTKNGALLNRASGECDVFITRDGRLLSIITRQMHRRWAGACFRPRAVRLIEWRTLPSGKPATS